METILFTILALGAVLTALLVITAPSPIASALYLVVTLFCIAGMYVLLAAPFVAAIQIIVYAGAVVVLILFVIMLLNLQKIEERLPVPWYIIGIGAAAVILLLAFVSIMTGSAVVPTASTLPPGFGSVKELGVLLFTKYLYAFEVAAVLLLAAVVGAVALVRRTDEEDRRAD